MESRRKRQTRPSLNPSILPASAKWMIVGPESGVIYGLLQPIRFSRERFYNLHSFFRTSHAPPNFFIGRKILIFLYPDAVLRKWMLSEAILALELMPEQVRQFVCNPIVGERYQWSYTAALQLIRYGYPARLLEPLLAHFRGRPDSWPGELRTQIHNAQKMILGGASASKAATPKVPFLSVDAYRVSGWLERGPDSRCPDKIISK